MKLLVEDPERMKEILFEDATANVKDFQNLGFDKVWNPLFD